MNITYKIYKINVIPQLEQNANVIANVIWEMICEEDGAVSISGFDTMLNSNNIENFIPLDQVTKEQLLTWLIATEGGEPFINNLLSFHAQQLEYKKARKLLKPVTQAALGFELDSRPFPVNQPIGSIPATTL